MKKVIYIQCDNPACSSVARPEEARGRLYTPYAWIILKGFVQGPGPSINITVCGVSCIDAAVDYQIRTDRYNNGE